MPQMTLAFQKLEEDENEQIEDLTKDILNQY